MLISYALKTFLQPDRAMKPVYIAFEKSEYFQVKWKITVKPSIILKEKHSKLMFECLRPEERMG